MSQQTYDSDADKKYAPGGHDDLGASAEQARAETAQLESQFAGDSTPGAKYEKRGANNDQLKAGEEDAAEDSLYNPEGAGKKRKVKSSKNGFWTKKKVGILGGGLGTGLLGGGLLLGTLSLGPLEAGAASKALLQAFSHNTSSASKRMNNHSRYARYAATGDIGETRVGRLGSKVYGSAIKQLSNMGVEFDRYRVTGRPYSMNIDQEKLSRSYPELSHMDATATQGFLADKLQVPADHIKLTSKGKFTVDMKGYDLNSMKLLTNNSLRLLNSKMPTAIQARVFKKFFSLPSMFHPIQRLRSSYLAKREALRQEKIKQGESEAQAAAEADAEAAQLSEGEDFKTSVTDPTASEAKAATGAIEDANSGLKGAVLKSANITGFACVAYNTAGEVAAANRAIVLEPAVANALRLIAVGEEAKAGSSSGIDGKQLGAVIKSFKGKDGTSIFQGKAFSALRNPTGKPTGKDLSGKYRSAFTGKSSARSIKDGAESIINKMLVIPNIPVINKVVNADTVCSEGGQIVVTAGQIGVSALGEIASGGLDTPATAALWAGEVAENSVISFAATTAVVDVIKNVAVDSALPEAAFSGAEGGSLVAFGARAGANALGMVGGFNLGNLAGSLGDTSPTDNPPQSLYARLFSLDNYNSLASQLTMSYFSSDLSSGLSGFASGLTHIGSMLSGGFSAILPRASAATVNNYNWGFPQYGIPDDMLDDPTLADPYSNAGQMATVLDTGAGTNYIDKAKSCFGVSVQKASDGAWDVLPDHMVDVTSDDYLDAGCTENSTAGGVDAATWRRMTMFVYDTSLMKATACYAGDDSSCADFDAGDNTSASGTTDTTTATTTGDAPSGDMASLAQQVLDNPKITLGPGAKPDLVAASKGQKVTPGPVGGGGAGTTPCTQGRVPVYLDTTLLKAMLLIARQYKYEIQDVVSDHACDSGRHPMGRAMDIFQVDGMPLSGHYNTKKVLDFVAGTTAIMSDLMPNGKYPHEAGIGVCSLSNVPNVPSNINYFEDACDELHVDVGTP